MARRKMEDPCTCPVNLRISEKMKSEMDRSADMMRVTTNDWIRKAIAEKIERDYKTRSESSCISISEVLNALDNPLIKAKIRDIVTEV